MEEYFRLFLIEIRKQYNTAKRPLVKMILTFTLLSGIGILIDTYLPFMFLTNMVRGILATTLGIILFSIAYTQYIIFKNNKLQEDRYYKSIRERFSYKQRINISIVLGAATFLLTILTNSNNSGYTLKGSVSIFILLTVLTFLRMKRSEFHKDVYEVDDIRDIEFIVNKNKKPEDKKQEK